MRDIQIQTSICKLLGLVAHTHDPSTREAKKGGSHIQVQPKLHREFKARLDFTMRPCHPKQKNKNEEENKTNPTGTPPEYLIQVCFLLFNSCMISFGWMINPWHHLFHSSHVLSVSSFLLLQATLCHGDAGTKHLCVMILFPWERFPGLQLQDWRKYTLLNFNRYC